MRLSDIFLLGRRHGANLGATIVGNRNGGVLLKVFGGSGEVFGFARIAFYCAR